MLSINKRLDKLFQAIADSNFIGGSGLGNEVSFYVFDYKAEQELVVRDYIKDLLINKDLKLKNRHLIEFDLYEMLIEIAKEDEVFEAMLEMEAETSQEEFFRALTTFTNYEMFIDRIDNEILDNNVILITGVGKIYPILRSHDVLNNLQNIINKDKSVILFYPGDYNEQEMKLFGKLEASNYYRAFKIVED